MNQTREIVSNGGSRENVASHTRTTIIIAQDDSPVVFLRGTQRIPSASDEDGLLATRVISALDKKVVGCIYSHGRLVESWNILTVKVRSDVVREETVQLDGARGSLIVNLVRNDDGYHYGEKKVLLVYGDDGDLGGAAFDGIELLDITESGALGFKPDVTVRSNDCRRRLGIIDFVMQESSEQGSAYRTSRYGLFKSRTPKFKIPCSQIGPNNLQVIVDDGDDRTIDLVDITNLIDRNSCLVDVSDLPVAVEHTSDRITGRWDGEASRSRLFNEPQGDGNLSLFLYGENRIRLKDSRDGTLLFEAHFLLYDQDDQTVVGPFDGEQIVTIDGREHAVAANHLLIDFSDSAEVYDISRYCYSLYCRPQGFTPDFRIVQAAPFTPLDPEQLLQRIEEIKGFNDAIVEDVTPDFLAQLAAASVTLERYPQALQPVGAGREFNPANGQFLNGQDNYFHHFYIHTFPAHRLIDAILYPDADVPLATVEGSCFEMSKTFLLPAARVQIQNVHTVRQANAGTKLALFGHTDSSGTDIYNNRISQLRAESVVAVLQKDHNWYITRLDGSAVSNERPWGIREIQYMLNALGHYNGPINGSNTPATRQAVGAFQDSVPIARTVNGSVNADTRQRLVAAYMDHLFNQHYTADDFFCDTTGREAAFGCGEDFPLIHGDPTNAQNRRVIVVFRQREAAPVNVEQYGSAVPVQLWLSRHGDNNASNPVQPPFAIGCADTGFGRSDNFSGEHLDEYNRFMIKGKRLVRPSDIVGAAANVTVYADGDVHAITDLANQHGSGVMTCMCSDGYGNEVGGRIRDATEIVLGTGKDSLLRPVRRGGTLPEKLRYYELFAADDEIKIVTCSYLAVNYSTQPPAYQAAVQNRIQRMIQGGKILFIAAGNSVAGSAERDVRRTEGGFYAPDRANPRNTVANPWQRTIVTVGATTHVTNPGDPELPTDFTYLGSELSIAAPGNDIRLVLCQNENPTIAGAANTVDGVEIQNWDGTSFATPMTAGIAAEMMLVNSRLQNNADQIRLIEMLEVSADPLPSLSAAPVANQGPNLPGSAIPDPQLVAADLNDYRRVHFWKAILCAVNDGIPTESRYGANPATNHFTSLTGKNHAATTWYGFEIRAGISQATIWFKKPDNSFERLEDSGAAMPGDRRTGATWRKTQPLRASATHATAGFRNFVLPAYPFAGAAWWMCQFSIKREKLNGYSELLVFPSQADPLSRSGGGVRLPPLYRLELAHIERMRNPGAITVAEKNGNRSLLQIAEFVEEFDDFVFHVTGKTLPLDHFVLIHPEGASQGQEIRVTVFAVNTAGCLDAGFNGNVAISHNGTNGANAGGTNSGVFINGNPAGGPVNIALANGTVRFRICDHTAENIRISARDGSGKTDDGNSPVINIGAAGAIAELRMEITHWTTGETITARPVKAGDRLKVRVTVYDDQERIVTGFTSQVELSILAGQGGEDVAGGAAPFKRGVHVADTVNDAYDANRFRYTYVAVDNGAHDFSVFNYTTGNVQLAAVCGAVRTPGPSFEVHGGAFDNFLLDYPVNVTAGNTFHLGVTVRDRYHNTITDYEGRVNCSLPAGGGTAGVSGPPCVGVLFQNTAGVGDDFHRFVANNGGQHNFPVTAYTAEQIRIRVTEVATNTTADTDAITVSGGRSLSYFEFEVQTSQLQGVRYRITVKAMDSEGNVCTNFTGNVNLTLQQGTPFAAAPPGGTQIHNSPHNYTAADQGIFTFEATSHTQEQVRFRAARGGIILLSPLITIR